MSTKPCLHDTACCQNGCQTGLTTGCIVYTNIQPVVKRLYSVNGVLQVTVRPMPWDRCPDCPVCNVGVLWPSGWMDQDFTWYGGRSRPRPHCVRWGPSRPHGKRHSSPHFCGLQTQTAAHVYCGETAGWIRMPLGTDVGLGPGDIVLDGNPAPPRKGVQQPPLFGPCLYLNAWMDQDIT